MLILEGLSYIQNYFHLLKEKKIPYSYILDFFMFKSCSCVLFFMLFLLTNVIAVYNKNYHYYFKLSKIIPY